MGDLLGLLFERAIKNPLSTLGGFATGAATWAVDQGIAFTWKGLLVALPSIVVGLLRKDSQK